MSKILLHPVFITILLIAAILSIPYFVPKKSSIALSDNHLRQEAHRHNLLSVPKDRDKMLSLLSNKDVVITPEKVSLGRALFFDPRLSRDETITCASCHILGDGGDDNRPTAIGYHHRANPHHINSPTVLNAALAKYQFWDARVKNVETQVAGPTQSSFEMNMTPKEIVLRLKKDSLMLSLFKTVFGENGLTFKNIKKSIGAFERTLLTRGNFDRFLDGNDSALNLSAKRGFSLFMERGCSGCHTGIGVGGMLIRRFPLHHYLNDYLGISFSPKFHIKKYEFPFENIGGFTGRDGHYLFRVPILRNVARTAPYFHNGEVKDLHEAVRIMSKYQLGKEFSSTEINDTISFLKSLNGKIVDYGYH